MGKEFYFPELIFENKDECIHIYQPNPVLYILIIGLHFIYIHTFKYHIL